MNASTDRMMLALKSAYALMTDNDAPADLTEEDPEKVLLQLMARAQALRDKVHNLEMREQGEEE